MIQTVESIRRQVVVGIGQQRAFELFTGDMTSWWPATHHIGTAPIAEVVVEPRAGGRWFTRHQDGSETSTGHVAEWEPYARVVLVWQLSAQWRFDPGLITHVELRFVPEADDRTRVELEHRDLDRYGADADKMRATFEAPDAWDGLLGAYAAEAAARA
jgi:hypothetical protein